MLLLTFPFHIASVVLAGWLGCWVLGAPFLAPSVVVPASPLLADPDDPAVSVLVLASRIKGSARTRKHSHTHTHNNKNHIQPTTTTIKNTLKKKNRTEQKRHNNAFCTENRRTELSHKTEQNKNELSRADRNGEERSALYGLNATSHRMALPSSRGPLSSSE